MHCDVTSASFCGGLGKKKARAYYCLEEKKPLLFCQSVQVKYRMGKRRKVRVRRERKKERGRERERERERKREIKMLSDKDVELQKECA